MSLTAGKAILLSSAAGGGYEVSRSLRFNSSDSAYLSRTMSSASSTYTLSMWVKRSTLASNYKYLFSSGNAGIAFYNGTDQFYIFDGGTVHATTGVYRDTSAWYHILLSVSSNTGAAYINGTQVLSGKNTASLSTTANATNIGRYYNSGSGDFYFDGYIADVYLIDGQALTPSSFTEVSATTGQLIPKAYSGSFGTNGFWLKFSDNSAATATTLGKDYSGNSNNWTPNNLSVRQVVQATYNSTYGSDITAGEAAKIFDGDLTTYGVATGNFVGFSYSGTAVAVKVENTAGTSKSFYIQPWVSGSPTNSGTFNTSGTNLWTVPASTTATAVFTFPAGYDGFARLYPDGTYADLRFYDIRTAQSEAAGNDSLVDTPTSYGTDDGLGGSLRGNYCTWNPLAARNQTLSDGNLKATAGSSDGVVQATIGMSSGKWYCEWLAQGAPSEPYGNTGKSMIGISRANVNLNSYLGSDAVGWGYYSLDGNKINSGSGSAYGATYTNGDIIGVAFDADNGTLTFYKNNVSQGVAYTGLTNGPYFFSTGSSHVIGTLNAGQRPFAYTAPSGFKALCTTNLPEPTIADGSTVMDVKLYTGNGSTQTISGLGFSPDLVWIKSRSDTFNNCITDAVRGTGKELYPNLTNVETTFNIITALNADGFDVSTQSGAYNATNWNGSSYVAWTWDAGSSTVTNNDGSITSQVRANASAGFSIVTYTAPSSGAWTVGHGLGVAPQFIITKSRSNAYQWGTYHVSVGNTGRLDLNSTGAVTTTQNSAWNNTSPTSTVFSMGSDWAGSGITYVAYCFAPVAGYSSFGNYVGNGSSDGVFVYTGHRPRWILLKATSIANESWIIIDTARSAYNVVDAFLRADTSGAEFSSSLRYVDILSNGFKLRASGTEVNGSGTTYVYASFAESPFAYSRAR